MTIKTLIHPGRFVENEIPDDFEFLRVTLMTGDEIVEVYCEDRDWGDPYLYDTIDPNGDNRNRSFFDCTYLVYPDQLEEWNKREDGYHRWQYEKFKETFRGYIDPWRG